MVAELADANGIAISKAEPALDPMLMSKQLVPQSAGTGAYRFVNGRPRILDS